MFQPPAGLRQTAAVHSLTGRTRHSLIIFGPDLEPNSTDSVLSSVNPGVSSGSELALRRRVREPV